MKFCNKCSAKKEISEFSKHKGKKDGLQSSCKKCVQAKSSADYLNNPAPRNISCAKWRASNPERHAANSMSWRKSNPEKTSEILRKYRSLNSEALSAARSRRRAANKNAEGTHTAADIKAIFEKQNGLCANCETKLFKSGKQKYHVDHIMPLKLGGSNWPSNLQCLCPDCNLRKNAKHPIDWANENGRLL